MAKQQAQRKGYRWQDAYIYKAYAAAAEGHTQHEIAAVMGVASSTFATWLSTRPVLREAVDAGVEAWEKRQAGPQAGGPILAYCYERLPPALRGVWHRIRMVWEEPNAAECVAMLVDDLGTPARQALFLHALGQTAWQVGTCMRLLGVSKRELQQWGEDRDFQALLDELRWHKGNFFEDKLLEAVAQGNTLAILHANRTYNRDRGYGETLQVGGKIEHAHQHTHQHTIALHTLKLDQDTMGNVLAAIEASGQVGEDGLLAIDGQATPVGQG